MIWPSERQTGSILDFSPLPKLFVYAANVSFGATPAYVQTVRPPVSPTCCVCR
jgi:hypothetical protein